MIPLNIVVPMAGRGSRFAAEGFTNPKPLIDVGGKPMIQWIIENVMPKRPHRFIFICLAEHLRDYPLVPEILAFLAPGCEIIGIDQVTEGAACTVLLAEHFIDNEAALMIVNSDQFVELAIDEYLERGDETGSDGLIMTFLADHPKWSFCRMNEDGTVAEVREKEVVSNEATVGIYNFSRGMDFVQSAREMISADLRVNGEFYVAPVYNRLIEKGHRIRVARTGTEYSGMYGLGTPGDLAFFKTTSLYESRSADNRSESAPLTKRLTACFFRFLSDGNLPGVSAMLAEDCLLEVQDSEKICGRMQALEHFRRLFETSVVTARESHNFVADASSSAMEYLLEIDGRANRCIDFIDWEDRLVVRLRSYRLASGTAILEL